MKPDPLRYLVACVMIGHEKLRADYHPVPGGFPELLASLKGLVESSGVAPSLQESPDLPSTDESLQDAEWMSRPEAADYLGISVSALDRDTSVPRHRIGRRVLFKKSDLEKM